MKNVLRHATMIAMILLSFQSYCSVENSHFKKRSSNHEYSTLIGSIIISLENKNQEIKSQSSDDSQTRQKIKDIQDQQETYLQNARLALHDALDKALDCSIDNKAALEEIAYLQNNAYQNQESSNLDLPLKK